MPRTLNWCRDSAEFRNALEGACSCIPSIIDKTDLLELRLRQIDRRVQQHYLRRVTEPAIGQVEELAREVNELRGCLLQAYEMLQNGDQS